MKPEKPLIRRASPEDAVMLARFAEKTFRDAFFLMHKHVQADFETYVASSFTEEKIRAELENDGAAFFIATIKSQWAGYVKLHKSTPPESVKLLPAIELSRLYSLQEYLGCGIGQALVEACVEQAKSKGFKSIWLGSWKENSRGNAFYAKMGFEIIGSKTFALGADIQEDHVFVKVLG